MLPSSVRCSRGKFYARIASVPQRKRNPTIVIIHAVNAAERFFAASRAGDLTEAACELAPDVVLLNPAIDDPVIGKDAVTAALRAVEAACDEFRHTHLLVDSATPLFGLVFEARVGDAALRGVDLIELDAADRISGFTVTVRPMATLMALGARISGA